MGIIADGLPFLIIENINKRKNKPETTFLSSKLCAAGAKFSRNNKFANESDVMHDGRGSRSFNGIRIYSQFHSE